MKGVANLILLSDSVQVHLAKLLQRHLVLLAMLSLSIRRFSNFQSKFQKRNNKLKKLHLMVVQYH